MALFCEMSRSIGMGDSTVLKDERHKKNQQTGGSEWSRRPGPSAECDPNIETECTDVGTKRAILTYLVE